MFLAILLLSTEACHLCELAQSVLQQVFSNVEMQTLAQQANFEIYSQDIIDQPKWLDQYGEKIPVLLDEVSGHILEWPFDAEQAGAWFKKIAASAGCNAS